MLRKTVIKSVAKSNAVRQLSSYINSENKEYENPIDEMNDAIPNTGYVGQVWSNVKDHFKEISERSRVTGYEEGKLAGIEEIKNEMANEVESFNKTVESFSDNSKNAFEEFEKSIVKLSVKIAEKIIKKNISEDDEFTLKMVNNVIKKAKSDLNIAVWVNPADYEFIIESFKSASNKNENVSLSVDENIEVGGCKIESDWGLNDMQIGTQLDVIYNKLVDDKTATAEESVEPIS